MTVNRTSSAKEYIPGTTLYGRSGLLFTETAETAAQGAGAVTGHLLYGSDDDFNRLHIPVGMNYGIAENVELAGSLEFISLDLDVPAFVDDTASGLGRLSVGGKYRIPGGRDVPDFAVGADIFYGPLSDDLGDDGLDLQLKGLVTHVLPQGVLLNGGVGILHIGSRDHEVRVVHPITGAVTTVKADVDSDTELQIHGGVGVPLTSALTGIAELGINQFGEDDGVLGLGLRGRAAFTWQAMVGIGLGDDAADVTLGGGLAFGF